MTALPVDTHSSRETRPHGAWKVILLVCAGLAVTFFWIFALFVLVPLIAG